MGWWCTHPPPPAATILIWMGTSKGPSMSLARCSSLQALWPLTLSMPALVYPRQAGGNVYWGRQRRGGTHSVCYCHDKTSPRFGVDI